jgi:NPH3 family
VYVQHHPQLSDGQKEQICQLIDVQNLSRDLCRNVAQNENLPIRVIVKALFCEMLDLKRSLADYGDGSNTRTEFGNTREDDIDSAEVKELTESKGAFSRIWYRERRWYRLRNSVREIPKEMKETEKPQGENVMCHFLKNKNILSVRRVKAVLTPTKK